MALVSAIFLTGLVLLAVPFWLHRLKTHSRDQHIFSSLFLMRAGEVPLQMKRELQHLMLLILRLLLLAVFCLAFAEPLIELAEQANTPDQEAENRIIIMDTSLSMRHTADGKRVFDLAQDTAARLVREMTSGSRAVLIHADDEIELMSGLLRDRNQLNSAIAASEPGSSRLALDGLLSRVSNLAKTLELSGSTTTVHLISDFQESAMPNQFNALIEGAVWPLTLHAVGSKARGAFSNWAVVDMQNGVNPQSGSEFVTIAIQGYGAPDRRIEVVLEQNEFEIGRQVVDISADENVSLNFEVSVDGRGSTTWVARLNIDDALEEDNVRRLVRQTKVETSLPVLVSEVSGERSYAYLHAAVQASASRFTPLAITLTSKPEDQKLDELAGVVSAAPALVLLDPGVLTRSTSQVLTRYLENGGAVLLIAGQATRDAGRIPLLDVALAPARFDSPSRGVIVSNNSHPAILNIKAWQDVRVFQTVKLATQVLGAELILTLDDGTPLLIENQIGAGRLMVLTSALDSKWNSLVVNPAFIDFIVNLLSYLAEDLLPIEILVGQAITLPAQSIQLFDASGRRVLGLGDTVGRPLIKLSEPGIYELRTPNSRKLLTVNTDIRESDLRPTSDDLLARWQMTTQNADVSERVSNTPALQASEQVVPVSRTGTERSVTLAPWLLVLLVLLVITEPLLANSGTTSTVPRNAIAVGRVNP